MEYSTIRESGGGYKIHFTIRDDSVYVRLRISMKLGSISLICVLVVVAFMGPHGVDSSCLMVNTKTPKVYLYHCFMSNNYLADIESAPIDIPRIKFDSARIQVIRNRSFARLSSGLESIQITYSEIGTIENSAFEGLLKLKTLEITHCNLQILKGAWFKGLPSLKIVSFANNDIKRIENSFFSIVPSLDVFDISWNDLNCIHTGSLTPFRTKKFFFRLNSLTWECMYALMDWVEKKGIEQSDFGKGDFDPSSEVLMECEDELRQSYDQLNGENMKRCALNTLNSLIPPQGDHTVGQIYQFMKERPSPLMAPFH